MAWQTCAQRPEPRTVAVHRVDPTHDAILMQRLDDTRTLQTEPDVDIACEVIARVLAGLHAGAGTARVPSAAPLATTFAEFAEDLQRTRGTGLVPSRHVDRALETLAWSMTAMEREEVRVSLLHNDCRFLNVLHVEGEAEPGDSPWRAIDPLPVWGMPELELVPALRNRWADAAATGDPGQALREHNRRMAETAETDVEVAAALAQAVATWSLLDGMPANHMFAEPYTVMSAW